MAVRVRVRDRDRGARKMQRQVDELARGRTVTVGIHREDGAVVHDEAGMKTVAQIAAIHEFGDEHQPPRPFLRGAIDGAQGEIEASLAGAARDVVRGASIESALQRVGDGVAETIRGGFDGLAALDPATVAFKGHGRVLEESGFLKSVITARVRPPKRGGRRG